MPFPFTTFSQDTLNHLVTGQRTMQDALNASDTETVTSGALSTTITNSELSVTGTQAYTLADGPAGVAGMRKVIRCTVAATIPAGTLTIASPETLAGAVCSATFFFDTVNQGVELLWTGTKWRALKVYRAGSSGANGVVIGTTVLTGKNLWAHYSCSVTGTVASTTTKGIPDGSAPGEQIQVGVATAATIPSGTISLTALTTLGAAGTTLGTMAATTNYAFLTWNGTGWMLAGNATLVLS